jgi:drug/metabolite transporter (DMT)-like permease
MTWQILIWISVLLYAVSLLLQRVLLKDAKSDPISFSIFFQVGVAVIIGIIVFIIQGKIPIPNLSNVSWSLFAMVVLYSLANIFIFKSLKITEASRFTVIFSSKTLFAVIGATLFFKEGLVGPQWVGAILIILGVMAVSFKDFHTKLNVGDVMAFVAAILFGLANTNDRFLVKFFDPYSYVVIGFLLPGIAIGLFYPKKLAGLKVFIKKTFIFKMLLLCLMYGLSAVSFFAALQIAPNSSQVFTVGAFGAIVTVALSILILKERDFIARKILGAAMSVTGLLLVNK